MRQIAQPRRPVDRRAGVVALIAQLHLAGMYADAQPDRSQRGPLQRQRAGHRVAGARERGHEAVALALLDRAHPVMAAMASSTVRFSNPSAAVIASGWVSHNRVEPSTSASSSVTVPVGSNSLKLQVSCGISACWLMVASIAATGRKTSAKRAYRHPGHANYDLPA